MMRCFALLCVFLSTQVYAQVCHKLEDYLTVKVPWSVRVNFNSKHDLVSLSPGRFRWYQEGQNLQIFKLKTKKRIYLREQSLTGTISEFGDYYARLGNDRNIYLLDLKTMQERVFLTPPKDPHYIQGNINMGPAGKFLLVKYNYRYDDPDRGDDYIYRTYSVPEGKFISQINLERQILSNTSFHFENREINFAFYEGDVQVRDWPSLMLKRNLNFRAPVFDIDVLKGGKYAAVALMGFHSEAEIFDISAPQPKRIRSYSFAQRNDPGIVYWVNSVHLPDWANGHLLFAGSDSSITRLYNPTYLEREDLVRTWEYEKEPTRGRYFYRALDIRSTPDGKYVAMAVSNLGTFIYKRNCSRH